MVRFVDMPDRRYRVAHVATKERHGMKVLFLRFTDEKTFEPWDVEAVVPVETDVPSWYQQQSDQELVRWLDDHRRRLADAGDHSASASLMPARTLVGDPSAPNGHAPPRRRRRETSAD